MAIDTAERRRSVAGLPFLPLGPGVTPDSNKDVGWRYQVAWNYSGVAVVVEARSRVLTFFGGQRDRAFIGGQRARSLTGGQRARSFTGQGTNT